MLCSMQNSNVIMFFSRAAWTWNYSYVFESYLIMIFELVAPGKKKKENKRKKNDKAIWVVIVYRVLCTW